MSESPTPIVTLDIDLSGWRGTSRKWHRAIEMPEATSLCVLHYAIQDAIGFDDDHMYEFYVGKRWNDREMEISDPASPIDLGAYETIALSDVFPLKKGRKLYYWFDFGDDWMFEISCRSEKQVTDKKAKYPRVVEKNGRNPQQYGR
jgi:hypothetical protein